MHRGNSLATVRIYRVAELLGTTSQEVMALLKRDHGIEVKSASSTIEEVVGRQFVDRLARQRGVTLPSGDIFAEGAAAKAPGKKPTLAKKAAPEPAKPAGPTLGPPRLVKAAKAIHQAERAAAAAAVETLEQGPAGAEAPETDDVEDAGDYRSRPRCPTSSRRSSQPPPRGRGVAAEVEASPAAPRETRRGGGIGRTGVARPAVAPRGSHCAADDPSPHRGGGSAARPAAATVRDRAPRSQQPTRGSSGDRRASVAHRNADRGATAAGRRAAASSNAAGIAAVISRATAWRSTTAAVAAGPTPAAGLRRTSGHAAASGRACRRPVARPGGQPGGYRPHVSPAKRSRRSDANRRSVPRTGQRRSAAAAAPPPITKSITLAEGMTVKDLADKLDARVKDVLKKLLEQGKMMTINSTLDSDTATAVAREFGADMQMRTFEQEMVDVESAESRPEDLGSRAPVVTVMGHVDHGKTTLLDAIRETRVAEREAGGITQHIGAYHVQVGDRSVVFLDTPGHEAFTMMRSRGAKVTDVVVLVVAADDGVMPQTKEAINHAKAANVPIVVAVNKIDKPGANPDNVKRELAELGLVPEAWGGTTVTVDVSAKKRQNLDLLLEMILLSSDILELKANPKKGAMGTVLEAKLDRGRGPVATILVQDGTLRVGDNFIAGSMVGKVRALIDDRGRPTKQAGPSTPVEVLGLTGLPQPGDTFQAVADAVKARQIALFRQEQAKVKALGAKGSRLTLESLKDAIAEGGVKELPLIVKADVQGSAEVLADSLQKLSDERVKIRIIHSGVGAINEFDVLLASAGNAIVIGFNVRPDRNAADVAERENVDVRLHSVIYNVTEEIKKAMTGLLEPTLKEARLGSATVRELFKVPKVGMIAGCMVTDGRITRSGDSQARLLRDNVVIHEGKISSLRRFKDDVSEVKAGFECGIAFERFNDLKVGDVIEVFVIERVATPA